MPLFRTEGTDHVPTHNGCDADSALRAVGIHLHCGDNITYLKKKRDDYYHAVITDPPYNLNFKYDTYQDNLDPCVYEKWCATWLRELLRVCRGVIAFTPGTVNLGMWYRIAEPAAVWCWHKPAAMGRTSTGFCNWEPILVYGNTKGLRDDTDVIHAPITTNRRLDGHPCPKPRKWAMRLVSRLAPERGQHVLDPFCGSGVVGSVCYATGRKFTGIDIDPAYIEVARKRIYGMQ